MVHLIGNEVILWNYWLKSKLLWRSRLSEDKIAAEFFAKTVRKKCKNTPNILLDGYCTLRSIFKEKKSLYILKPCGEIGQSLEGSLQGGKQVNNLEISRSCYQSWPSASVDNILLDLHNSSHPTQPRSIIANYFSTIFQVRWCAFSRWTLG